MNFKKFVLAYKEIKKPVTLEPVFNVDKSKIISSVGYDQTEIIKNILYLHSSNKKIDIDVTYSEGNFYRNGIEKPKYKFDKFPIMPGVIEADSMKIPLENNCVETFMFDPPFVISGVIKEKNEFNKNSSIIGKRFNYFTSFDELKNMYYKSMKEAYRILKQDGILIFKCQDCIASATQYLSHCYIINKAEEIGFYALDLFVLIARHRITDNRIQQHARKFHCYFLVFKKTNKKGGLYVD